MQTMQGYKYRWKFASTDHTQALAIAHRYNLSLPVAHLLLSRHKITHEDINDYLFSSYEQAVANPALLKDAERAIDRIERAITQKEKMLVFGDYDVDGITSSALIITCLSPLRADINFFLPHRVRDGYGLSTTAVKRAATHQYKIIITVDNGITAVEPAQEALRQGIDLIITDHHQPHGSLPAAYAIVNPHQENCAYPFKEFAGVGVIFKLMSLLYARRGLSLPEKAYELLLLGTIADVVPLVGENRFWVRYGLAFMHRTKSLSFTVLKQNAGLEKPRLTASDIGFNMTPQLIALGRLDVARQGVKILLGTN